MKLLTVFLLLSATALSQNKLSAEVGFGFLKNNTRDKLVEHMKDNDYDHYVIDYNVNWFDPADSVSFHIDHPKEQGFGSTLLLKLFYSVKPKLKVGLALNYDNFGTVTGNNHNFEEYSVRIKAFRIFPTCKFEVNKYFALTLAPGLIINTSQGIFRGFTDNYSVSPQSSPTNQLNRKLGGGFDIGAYVNIPIDQFYLFSGFNASFQTNLTTGTLNSTSAYPLKSLVFNNSHAGLVFGIGINIF